MGEGIYWSHRSAVGGEEVVVFCLVVMGLILLEFVLVKGWVTCGVYDRWSNFSERRSVIIICIEYSVVSCQFSASTTVQCRFSV